MKAGLLLRKLPLNVGLDDHGALFLCCLNDPVLLSWYFEKT